MCVNDFIDKDDDVKNIYYVKTDDQQEYRRKINKIKKKTAED